VIGRLAFAIVATLSLGGCCRDGFAYSFSHSSALAEVPPLPKPYHVRSAKPRHRNKSIAAIKDISTNDDDASIDDELKRKLVICRGCDMAASGDQPSSIWPTSSAEHLTTDQVSRLFPALPK
jgi:hypothetical protein